jgi:GH25 family lysozyme M1 (1,4-beta-N-acetylmuramidase)
MVGGWKSFMFWQFTDSGRITGASSSLDMNLFNGSHAELVALTVSPAAAKATRYTTVRADPSRTVRTDATSTSPSLGSWLKVFGLDGSRKILGH